MELKLWLQNNLQPWEMILDYWKKTSQGRLAEFKNCNDCNVTRLISEWPRFKDEYGDQLVNRLFCLIYLVNY